MRIKLFTVVVITTMWLVALAPVHAQAPAARAPAATAAKPYTPPRTPDGQPDIQGVYQRRGVGGLDAGALEAQDHRPENPLDPTEANPLSVSSRPDGLNNTDSGFLAQIGEKVAQPRAGGQRGRNAQPQQLLGIAEPGRILPWKPEADKARRAFLLKTNPSASLKYVELDARCALPGLFFGGGPFQFLQSQGQVVILSEYSHFTRFIHIDGRPHLGKNIKLFMGDSLGKWEGNTLVVDTTNYNGLTAYSREIPILTDALHTTERFTIVDADTIDYEVTIDDPNQFSKPWKTTGRYNRGAKDLELLEYACAEGSQTLRNIFGDYPTKQ